MSLLLGWVTSTSHDISAYHDSWDGLNVDRDISLAMSSSSGYPDLSRRSAALRKCYPLQEFISIHPQGSVALPSATHVTGGSPKLCSLAHRQKNLGQTTCLSTARVDSLVTSATARTHHGAGVDVIIPSSTELLISPHLCPGMYVHLFVATSSKQRNKHIRTRNGIIALGQHSTQMRLSEIVAKQAGRSILDSSPALALVVR